MVSIKPLYLNLYGGKIQPSNSGPENSCQLEIIGTPDGDNIQTITASWNSLTHTWCSCPIPFLGPQESFLLTVLNYIGRHNLRMTFDGDPTKDDIQGTLNAFSISLACLLAFDKFSQDPEFNQYCQNPFGADPHTEKILYKLQYLKNSNPDFIFRPIVSMIKKFLGIFVLEPIVKIDFLKSMISDLYKFYEWDNPQKLEIVSNVRKSFFNTTESYHSQLQKTTNFINELILNYYQWLSELQRLKIRSFESQKMAIKKLLPEGKFEEAPINYPKFHHLELYDSLVAHLDLNEIQKRESLKILIKSIISNFDFLYTIDFKSHPEFKDLKFDHILTSLRGQLWQYHQKINSYDESILLIQQFYESTNNLIHILMSIYPYQTYDYLTAKVSNNCQRLKNLIVGHKKTQDTYQSYIDNFLKSIVKLESASLRFEEDPKYELETVDWESLILTLSQKEESIQKIKDIIGYAESVGFKVEYKQEIVEEIIPVEVEDVIIPPVIYSNEELSQLVIKLTAEIKNLTGRLMLLEGK